MTLLRMLPLLGRLALSWRRWWSALHFVPGPTRYDEVGLRFPSVSGVSFSLLCILFPYLATTLYSPQLQIPFLGGMGRSPVHRRCFAVTSLRSYVGNNEDMEIG